MTDTLKQFSEVERHEGKKSGHFIPIIDDLSHSKMYRYSIKYFFESLIMNRGSFTSYFSSYSSNLYRE